MAGKKMVVLLVMISLTVLDLTMKVEADREETHVGNWRYSNSSGEVLKEQWIGDYYVDKLGLGVVNQWINREDNLCFVGRDGKMIPDFRGGWFQIEGERVEGWNVVNGREYHFDKLTGAMTKNKWIGNRYVGENGYVTKTLPKKVLLTMEPLMQNPELPTGCESVALTMALEYSGFEIEKTTIADHYLEYSNSNFVSAFLGNPRTGNGAGCYAPGIKIAADKFLEAQGSDKVAEDITGTALSHLYRSIADGYPVIVWSTMYMHQPVYSETTYTLDDKTYRWYGREHCVVLCGYDKEKNIVTVNDPLEGIIERDADSFEDIYDAMGRMAVEIR